MSHSFHASFRNSLLLSVPIWCGLVASSAHAACVANAAHDVTCDGAIINQASPPGTGYPITVYDKAANFQPTGGSNSYTPTTYSQNPATALVTINPGATFTVNVTTANRAAALSDNGVIAANFSNKENPAVNNVTVNNSGSIVVNNALTLPTNRVHAIVADSQVNNFTVNNAAGATIAANQVTLGAAFNSALLQNTASGSPATYTPRYGTATSTLAITSGIYSDDNTNSVAINNAGTISATGHYAAAYYGRADTTIVNTGTFGNSDWKPTDRIYDGHWSIGTYGGAGFAILPGSNPDTPIYDVRNIAPNAQGVMQGTIVINSTSATTLTNSGTINGDILALDTNPLVTAVAAARSQALPLAASSTNSGPRDSSITNNGVINGNFYLGSGAHDITNEAGGTINGSVNIDQRPSLGTFAAVPTPGTAAGTYQSLGPGTTTSTGAACPAAGSNTTDLYCARSSTVLASFVGSQTLTLKNSGSFNGNVSIIDQATSTNRIVLNGNGFTGTIAAVNGIGSNTLVLNNVSTLQSVRNFSTIDLNRSNVAVANGITLVSGAKVKTTVYGPGGTRAAPSVNLGTINGALTLAGPTTVVADFKNTFVRNGDVYQVASTVNGAGAADVTVKQKQTALIQTSRADTSDGRLLLVTNVRDPRTFSGVSQPAGATLQGLLTYSGNNPQVRALGAIVERLPTQAAVRAAGDQLAPNTNGADVQVPINATMLFHQQIDSRLDNYIFAQIPSSGRSADLGPGRPAPVYGVLPADGGWIEGIGGGIHQSTVNNVGGYNAELEGVIGGIDRLVTPNFRVGGAFGFINAQVNGNQVGGRRETIQTFQGLGYAEFSGANYYLRGSAGYGGVNFQSSRQIAFAGFSDTAFGSHSGNVFTARGEGGAPVEYRNSLLIPYAAFTYSRLEQNAYTEVSANGAGLAYQFARNNSERSEVGGKVIVPLAGLPAFSYLFPAGSTVALEARAAYVHEFGNVAQTVSASFAGAGAPFIAAGPVPNRDMVDYGVGLRMGSGPVQIDISYNGLARSTYLQQVGLLRARYLF